MLTAVRKVRLEKRYFSSQLQLFSGVIHAQRFGKSYHFSWKETGPNKKWDWEGARNYCRKFCMDSISIDTKEESTWVTNLIRKEKLHYIWTGGRKCNFQGCDRKDLQPLIENGWYWAPTGKRIPAPRACGYCNWSHTGGLRKAQPDNREEKQGGKDEACIGILNDVYKVQEFMISFSHPLFIFWFFYKILTPTLQWNSLFIFDTKFLPLTFFFFFQIVAKGIVVL